ncbi:MAG: SPASM domain-containing protein [Deltaproteobacteria bacterium]|nr:SPASM domain-containing protein [Deltaproteobacteria bacterium]
MAEASYYVSRYLNVYPSQRNSSILFHGMTGCIDEIDRLLAHRLTTDRVQGRCFRADGLSVETLQFLEKRGHLTTLSPDAEHRFFCQHVETLHQKICAQRKQRGSLMLIPSYYCNLACFYCYQHPLRAKEGQNVTHVMTPELVDLIFQTVIKRLYPDVPRYSSIAVDLYGGEPFLERNRPALERIFQYTRDYQMPVSAISNASSLGVFVDFFGIEPGQVNALQISFDGDKLHHDQSRITHYGEGTFDAILANIHRLLDRGVRIKIRVNTNKNTVDSLQCLWEQLEADEITSHPNVSPYAQAIHNHYDQTNPEPIFSRATLTRRVEAARVPFRTPLDTKMTRLLPVIEANGGIPLRRTNFCMQNTPNAFLIDQRRDIYSCYEEAGYRQLAVGHFDENGEISLNDRYAMYQRRHVGMYEPCSKCAVALTCGGGCAIAARGAHWKSGTIFASHCDSHKELVATAIQRLLQNRADGLKTVVKEEDSWNLEQPYL